MTDSANTVEQLRLLSLDDTRDTSSNQIEDVVVDVAPPVGRKGRKIKDLTGNRYGRLTVVSVTDERASGDVVWLCRCDCGTMVKMATGSFRAGTRSCGCLGFGHHRSSHRRNGVGTLPQGAKSLVRQERENLRSLFKKYRAGGMKRGYEWKLTIDDFIVLTQQPCYYCGEPPSQEHISLHGTTDGQPYIYNGIDRVDNKRGYEIDNVVPCCKRCNYAKRDTDGDDFKAWVAKVAKRLKLVA